MRRLLSHLIFTATLLLAAVYPSPVTIGLAVGTVVVFLCRMMIRPHDCMIAIMEITGEFPGGIAGHQVRAGLKARGLYCPALNFYAMCHSMQEQGLLSAWTEKVPDLNVTQRCFRLTPVGRYFLQCQERIVNDLGTN